MSTEAERAIWLELAASYHRELASSGQGGATAGCPQSDQEESDHDR